MVTRQFNRPVSSAKTLVPEADMDSPRLPFDLASAGLRMTPVCGPDVPEDHEGGTLVIIKPKRKTTQQFQPPRMWKVIIHNDNTTTFDFVWHILQKHFNKTFDQAQRIAMTVHTQGAAVAGVYPREIAEHKTEKAMGEIRQTINPATNRPVELKLTCEPE